MRQWTDQRTGRTVRQLTDHPEGATLGYFRTPKHLPGGWVMAAAGARGKGFLMVHPESGEVKPLRLPAGQPLRVRERDGCFWYLSTDGKALWTLNLPDGEPKCVGERAEVGGAGWQDVCADGRTMVFTRNEDLAPGYPLPTVNDPKQFWHFFSRPRRGSVWSCDMVTGTLTRLVETEGVCPNHLEASITDPMLVRFCHDNYEAFCQRIWTVRTDGSGLRKIRPQERGENVVHEFWWPGGKAIAYKYMDRRNDPTIHERPWGELSPVPLRFALADLEGREFYLSDPLNHYHSHIHVSNDCRLLCGEGTGDDGTVDAASFSTAQTRIDFIPLASIHTPNHLFIGNSVNASFTPDSRWLLYNDTVDGKLQVCAVGVDLG